MARFENQCTSNDRVYFNWRFSSGSLRYSRRMGSQSKSRRSHLSNPSSIWYIRDPAVVFLDYLLVRLFLLDYLQENFGGIRKVDYDVVSCNGVGNTVCDHSYCLCAERSWVFRKPCLIWMVFCLEWPDLAGYGGMDVHCWKGMGNLGIHWHYCILLVGQVTHKERGINLLLNIIGLYCPL